MAMNPLLRFAALVTGILRFPLQLASKILLTYGAVIAIMAYYADKLVVSFPIYAPVIAYGLVARYAPRLIDAMMQHYSTR